MEHFIQRSNRFNLIAAIIFLKDFSSNWVDSIVENTEQLSCTNDVHTCFSFP